MDIVLRYATKVGVMDHGELKSVSTPLELFQNEDVLTNLKIEPPKVFSVARSLIKNGLNIDLGKIKDVSSLAKEIAGVEEKMNNMALGRYRPYQTSIHKLDARVKIIGMISVIVAIF